VQLSWQLPDIAFDPFTQAYVRSRLQQFNAFKLIAQGSMKPIDLRIAEELGVGEHQVAAPIALLDGGATVPTFPDHCRLIPRECANSFLITRMRSRSCRVSGPSS
jgi:hypothetical protein